MDRLQSMRVFCKVASGGSFTRAADDLDMSVAVVSRLVVDLEQHLRTRLFNRTTRTVRLTEAGNDYFVRCQYILEQIDEADAMMADQAGPPSGNLRMLISFSGGMLMLGPHLARFRREYPGIVLDIHQALRVVDIVAEGFDLAIQPRPYLASTSVVVRELMRDRLILCATPSYVRERGTPSVPEELEQHNCMSFAHGGLRDEWVLYGAAGEVRITPNNVLISNNLGHLLDAVRGGLGIGPTFERLVCDELRNGTLVRVLPAYYAQELDYFIVYPSRKYVPPKVRAMVDFLLDLYHPR
jgi:DNA-binding transcriptional LysR family regulator